jgi:O-6-methylguanine DNA methyltransferase
MHSSFREKVYILTQQIPSGKVVTYSQLAKMAGSPKAARAVGMCMKNNTNPSQIPCHRVIASDGKLVDYAFGGVSAKKEKLLKEGVVFVGEKIDLISSQWQPENFK